jgi:hypothetical protein
MGINGSDGPADALTLKCRQQWLYLFTRLKGFNTPEGCILNFYRCVKIKSCLALHTLNICLALYTYSMIIIIIIIIIIHSISQPHRLPRPVKVIALIFFPLFWFSNTWILITELAPLSRIFSPVWKIFISAYLSLSQGWRVDLLGCITVKLVIITHTFRRTFFILLIL